MLSTQELNTVIGRPAYTPDGDKIGKVSSVYVDDATREPTFVAVHTGLFGTHESFIPVRDAAVEGEGVTVPFSKDKVKEAPHVDAEEGHLDPQEERRIYDYYGMPYDVTPQHFTDADEADRAREAGAPDAGRHRPDDAMTVSEERLAVGTRPEEAGRARLRKYVETEHVTQSVPVRKERAVVEHEPITDENIDRSVDGPEITENEYEVTLHEERPVVEKRTEPVERVRLAKEADVDEETVSEDLRRERVETEGADDSR